MNITRKRITSNPIIRSRSVAVIPLVYTPDTEKDYLKLIAYEPSNRLRRLRSLIDRYREQEVLRFEHLIAL